MTADNLRVPDFLGHILDAIERIRKYTRNLIEQEFYSNELVQDAAVRNFEVMGEASRNIERRGKVCPLSTGSLLCSNRSTGWGISLLIAIFN